MRGGVARVGFTDRNIKRERVCVRACLLRREEGSREHEHAPPNTETFFDPLTTSPITKTPFFFFLVLLTYDNRCAPPSGASTTSTWCRGTPFPLRQVGVIIMIVKYPCFSPDYGAVLVELYFTVIGIGRLSLPAQLKKLQIKCLYAFISHSLALL